MIACYKQNIHLLPFADVFLKNLFVFAGGGGDSSIGHYGGGEIAQLIRNTVYCHVIGIVVIHRTVDQGPIRVCILLTRLKTLLLSHNASFF